MAQCNLTQRIPSTQCIGDSLRTINSNFSALEVRFCTLPTIQEGESFEIDLFLDPQSAQTSLELSPEPVPVFKTKFDSVSNVVTLTSINLTDGTNYEGYIFPYRPILQDNKPFGTFADVSTFNGSSPKLSLFWTASGSYAQPTIYNLNSAVSLTATTLTEPNDEVLCFLKDGDTLYMGGSFTKIGTQTIPKLVTISLSSGNNQTGTPDSQLSSLPVFQNGSIRCLGQYETQVESFGGLVPQKFLVIGGDFTTTNSGRGLVIYNQTLKFVKQAFYFNGQVNDVAVDQDNNALYVVGQFDWINFGAIPATENSEERIYCNNFVKFNLNQIDTVNAVDLTFLANSSKALEISNQINAVAYYNNAIFLGGDLQLLSSTGKINNKNLVCLRRTDTEEEQRGSILETFKFIFDKPIYTMLVDNETLYIGGRFNVAASYDDFYNFSLSNRDDLIKADHIACLNLTNFYAPIVNTVWKPKFNDVVYKLATTSSLYDSEIYALGSFTEVNNIATDYVAAVTKATSLIGDAPKGLLLSWNISLNAGPTPKKLTNALLRDTSNSLFIGGNFTKINQQIRKKVAKIPTANQHISETSPQTVEFEFGGQVVDAGRMLTIDFDTIEKTTQVTGTGSMNVINKTVFAPLTNSFKGIQKNQMCRFYIKRNGLNDVYQKDVYILGWTLTYEKI
jgi:hypothetical protein